MIFIVAPARAVDASTYSRDVAPIFFESCAQCHRPGAVAPMSLLTYQDARPWAKSIAKQVQNRDMPPWSGESDRHVWANDISLSDDEIATIVQWTTAGAPEGIPGPAAGADVPDGLDAGRARLRGHPRPGGRSRRERRPLREAGQEDRSRPPRWIRAIEFLPGDRRVVHHYQVLYNTSPQDGEQQGGQGVFAISTAGMPPYVFPDGMGRVLGKRRPSNSTTTTIPWARRRAT